MAVSLLIITHDNIGQSLVDTAYTMLSMSPLHIDVLSINKNTNPDEARSHAMKLIENNSSTLVLTDMYGSTPSNIACHLQNKSNTRIVSGLNLPMLVRVLNYPQLELDELVEKALSGGQDGVFTCNGENHHA